MTLAQKLILYALLVALIPLAATGFTLIRVGEEALRQRISEHQQSAATAVSAKVSQAVEDVATRLLTVMQVVDVQKLGKRERQGLLRLLYQQSDDVSAAVIVSGAGDLLSPPIFIGSLEETSPELSMHPRVAPLDVERFISQLPQRRAKPGMSLLMSPPYFPEDGAARVAVSVPCCAGPDGQPAAAAGIELALRNDILRIEGIDTGPESVVFVVDQKGHVIMHPTLPVGSELLGHGAVLRFSETGGRGTTRFEYEGRMLAAAYSPVGGLGWAVVVQQPEEVAFAAAKNMRQQTLIWILITTLVVLLSGLVFAGRLRRALTRMVQGARAFGVGRLQERIEMKRGDEFGELADTMNSMASALDTSLRELKDWSLTLEQKVELRTEELKEAQSQLLMTSKLAAIGQLGAGVAHEVNNPLAGILGYAQLLLRKHPEGDPDRDSLLKIEEAAKRCKEITINLLRFSERGLAGRSALDINDVVKEVLGIVEGGLAEEEIELELDLDAALEQVTADAGQIALVLLNIINNSRNAMPEGGKLRVASSKWTEEPGVCVTIADSGAGIAPDDLPRIFEPFFTTKSVWTAAGLGLSVAFRIVTDHGGRIEVDSEPGRGTRLEVYLPVDPAPAQLETASKRPSVLD